MNATDSSHTFTVTVEKDLGDGGGWVAAAGETVTAAETGVGSLQGTGTCETGVTDGSGQCTIIVDSSAAGQSEVDASATVTVVGVTKTVPVPRIRELLDAGLTHLGENRLQEAVPKMRELADRAPTWHFIGHLQTNKAERAIEVFDRIESVDSLKLAKVLSRSSEEIGRDLRVFVQAKLGDEATKHGVGLEQLVDFVGAVNELPGISATGLMAIPPKRETEAATRADFQTLRQVPDAPVVNTGHCASRFPMGSAEPVRR